MTIQSLKTTFTFLLTFALVTLAKAQKTIIVSNTPNTSNNYSKLQDAVNAAKAGDTIYVQQSETHYNETTVNKRLHIIGRSHSDKDYTTTIYKLIFTEGSNGSSVQSCTLNINFDLSSSSIADINIKRCKISLFQKKDSSDTTNTVNNITIIGSVFDNFYSESSPANFEFIKNLNFTNNVVIGEFIFKATKNNLPITIKNCIFSNSLGLQPDSAIVNTGTESVTVANCIFVTNHKKAIEESGKHILY